MDLRELTVAIDVRPGRRLPRWLMLAAALGMAGVVDAREPAPVESEDDGKKREPLSLKLTDLALEMNGEFDQSRVRTSPPRSYTTNQTDRTWRLAETGRL